jgi:hypothetical protein
MDAKERKTLRSFGLIVGGLFCVIGLWPVIRRGEAARAWALAIGSTLALLAAAAPGLLRGPHRAWMALGHILGRVNSALILTAVFFLIVTPIGLVMRAVRGDALRLRRDARAATYRVPKTARDRNHFDHQF